MVTARNGHDATPIYQRVIVNARRHTPACDPACAINHSRSMGPYPHQWSGQRAEPTLISEELCGLDEADAAAFVEQCLAECKRDEARARRQLYLAFFLITVVSYVLGACLTVSALNT